MQIRNNKYLTWIVLAFAVFMAWYLVSYKLLENLAMLEPKYQLAPLGWAIVFVFLNEKGRLNLAINFYVLHLLFLIADHLSFWSSELEVYTSYFVFSLSVLFLLCFLYQHGDGSNRRIISFVGFVVSLFLYTTTLFYIVYAVEFNAGVTKEVLHAMFQTNVSEAVEFVGMFISPVWIAIVLLAVILCGSLTVQSKYNQYGRINVFLLSCLVLACSGFSYASFENLRLYSLVTGASSEYWKEIELFKETQRKLTSGVTNFDATKDQGGETYVVVIGESLNKNHMGLYGYLRETTPKLSKRMEEKQLVLFDSAYSSHTHTMPALSLSLTEATQLNDKTYYDSLSIVNVLKKAGFETHWVTNQVVYGAWDNLVSIIGHQTDNLVALNKSIGKTAETQKYDGALVTEVNKILKKQTDSNRIIFVHLMGNHGRYCKRYPAEFEVYSGDLAISEFGTKAKTAISESVNCYDNSVVYNDFVIDSLVNTLKAGSSVSGLLYFADHGENVFDQLGHNSANFTFDMVQIPLLFWGSDGYRDRYNDKYETLVSNRNRLFVNDYIHDTLIGMVDVRTDKYQSSSDLFSGDYDLAEEDAKTLTGEKNLNDDSHRSFHQKKNIEALKVSQKLNRIIPHRVNSLGKLNEVWASGYRSFEVDIVFDELSNKLVVGHDKKTESGIALEQFLSYIPAHLLEKVWVDFKNLSVENTELVAKEFERIDEQFSIKDKVIFESGIRASIFSKFAAMGWHTSYYLPTKQIVDLIAQDDAKGMEALSSQIAHQAAEQGLAAVSFDKRLYPFITDFLQNKLGASIVYHSWDLSLKLYQSNFPMRVSDEAVINDPRVKTVLAPFYSQFNL